MNNIKNSNSKNKINEACVNKEIPKENEKNSNLIEYKEKLIKELEDKLSKFKFKEKDIILRAKAEVENMRRRTEQEIEKIHKFALENFIIELLPVIDNLERAIKNSNKDNKSLLPMIEGVELTFKSLIDVLLKFGVKIVDKVNIPFDPDIHQAINIIQSDTHKPNHVIEIVQKGYKLNNRLIRPAMVLVSKTNVI